MGPPPDYSKKAFFESIRPAFEECLSESRALRFEEKQSLKAYPMTIARTFHIIAIQNGEGLEQAFRQSDYGFVLVVVPDFEPVPDDCAVLPDDAVWFAAANFAASDFAFSNSFHGTN